MKVARGAGGKSPFERFLSHTRGDIIFRGGSATRCSSSRRERSSSQSIGESRVLATLEKGDSSAK
jgi:hypothetical protein